MTAWLRNFVAPTVTVATLVVLWQLAVVVLQLPSHLLPAPISVLTRLVDGLLLARDFWPHLQATLIAMILGLTAGATCALLIAFLFHEFPLLGRTFRLLLTAFQSVPKVALAPLILIWVGYGLSSKVVLVGLVCFYPVFTAASAGLRSINPDLRNLLEVSGATRIQRLLHLNVPSVAAQLLTGLQIAFGFSLLGCVVIEFLLGTEGVGYLIDNSANSLDAATAVAAMVAVGAIGAAGSLAFRWLRQTCIFWDRGIGQLNNGLRR